MRNGGGNYVIWKTGDADTVRSLLTNGSATGSFTATEAFSTLELRAAGTYTGTTAPKVRVTVDGKTAGDITLSSKSQQTYALTGAWESGTHKVEVVYLNDSGQNSAVLDYLVPVPGTEASPAPAPAPTPGPAPRPTPPPTAPAPAAKDYSLHPFSSSAFSNTPVGPAVSFAAAGDSRHGVFQRGGTNVNSSRWSISVQQAKTSDPVATVRATAGGTHSIRIPVNATTTGGTDQHMTVIQPDKKTAYEVWGMKRISSTEWTARYLVKTDIQGEGMAAGARASGISHLHGLIRKDELKNLSIKHSIAIGIGNAQLKSVNNGTGVWPAQKEDGDSARAYTGNIPMGSMFALPASTNIDALGLTPEGKALAQALKEYGGHVLIRSSGVTIYAEAAADQTQVESLKKDWAKLRPLLRVVTNNTSSNIAGAR
ncbi:carbohydrate-binding domain-containing protein [Arthrobacter sp. TB 23]|uniref:carbohydrate-binding domain-containing protein n=1 Tax=Arthrobacter sp. TB 23 TaxID=494419 RepID=UPI0002E402CB|nr:carbohydrate-binding domain-containing protein [Arthrobacter sp. TB 23]